MAINPEAPEDPEPAGPTPSLGTEPIKKVRRKALASARRDLSAKELQSPASIKLLLDDLDRLEEDNTELCGYRSRFHEADKKVAVLQEKQKAGFAQEIISTACITIGGAALGYAPSQPNGVVALIFGVVLIIAGITAKAVKSS